MCSEHLVIHGVVQLGCESHKVVNRVFIKTCLDVKRQVLANLCHVILVREIEFTLDWNHYLRIRLNCLVRPNLVGVKTQSVFI